MNDELKNIANKVEILFEKITALEQFNYTIKETLKGYWVLIKIVGTLFLIIWGSCASLLAYTYNNQNQYETDRFNARNADVDLRFNRIFQQLDSIRQEKSNE